LRITPDHVISRRRGSNTIINAFLLRNSNTIGNPGVTLPCRIDSDFFLAADWNGDGTGTIGVFRPSNSTFYLRNSNAPGEPDIVVAGGTDKEVSVGGDWDGQ
jgi:hypothetical protein